MKSPRIMKKESKSPKSKIKKVFLALILFLVLIFFLPIISLQFLKYEGELNTDREFCINGFFLHPRMYDVQADFAFNVTEFSSTKLCVLPNQLLEEKKGHDFNVEFLSLFKKDLTSFSAEYPQIAKLPEKEEYHVKDIVRLELNGDESPFLYYLSFADEEVECDQEGKEVICKLEGLALKQGTQYDLEIYSKYAEEKTQDLGELVVKTPPAVVVKGASIKEGSVFYEEISEISLTFSKSIAKELAIKLENSEGEEIPFEFDLNETKLLLKTKESIKIGNVVKLTLKDVNGTDGSFLEQEYVLNFSVLERPPKSWWEYPDDIVATAKNGNDLLVVVSKKYKLPTTFVPSDLVSVSQADIRVDKSILVRSIIVNDLKELGIAAKAEGIDLSIVSGYRSYSTQGSTYQYWLSANGGNVSTTDQISARPGHSEHQLGTTIDFGTNKAGFSTFNSTPAATWLENNAYKYGFALSYPLGSHGITGFTYEGWHYRYIGRDNAQQQKSSGLVPLQWLLKQ